MFLAHRVESKRQGSLKMLAVDERASSVVGAFATMLRGRLGHSKVRGVHYEETDEITIDSDCSDVILDGETFRAERGRPILLRSAQPLSFVKLAA
jgi:hypothetical protein